MKLQGIFPALTTCFDYEGNLYKAKVYHNIEKLNRIALAGYTVCGSTGETPLLSVAERLQLMECVHETVRIANEAAKIGYHFALVLTPFYYRVQMYRPDTQALFFRAVADRSTVPILLYNIPQVTGYDLPVDTIAALSEHPNIAGMKDSSGNLEKLEQTVKAVKPGFAIFSGSGANFGTALQRGSAGAILAIANPLPYACVTIWEAFRRRELEIADDWQARIAPASKLIGTKYGIPGLKYAMDLNGYYGGPPRLPFVPPCAEGRAEIEKAFDGLRS